MTLEERVVDLEVRVAFQDKLITELDEVIREFSNRVESLEALVKDLKDSANAIQSEPTNDPPPHY